MTRYAALFTSVAFTLCANSALAQVAPMTPQGARMISQQWMTTADGCSYSRTQAPGQRPLWILIQNPHHIGAPNAHRGCKSIIQG